MSVVLLLALAAATAVSVSAPDAGDSAAVSACRDLVAHADDLGPIQLRRLNELPSGVLVHAVYRVVRGCPVAEVLVMGETYYVPSIVQREDRLPGERISRRDFTSK